MIRIRQRGKFCLRLADSLVFYFANGVAAWWPGGRYLTACHHSRRGSHQAERDEGRVPSKSVPVCGHVELVPAVGCKSATAYGVHANELLPVWVLVATSRASSQSAISP